MDAIATIRVSEEGWDALNNTDSSKFYLYADDDHILIKECLRGSGNVDYPATATIPHNLGYIPFFMVYCQVATGRYRVANSFDPVGSGWKVYSDITNLYIINNYDSGGDGYTGYQYYIFYDNMN